MVCWTMQVKASLGRALVKNIKPKSLDRTKLLTLARQAAGSRFRPGEEQALERQVDQFLAGLTQLQRETNLTAENLQARLTGLGIRTRQTIPDFQKEGVERLTTITIDFTKAFQQAVRKSATIKTGALDAHEFGEGIVLGFQEIVDKVAADWDLTKGLPTIKTSVVNKLLELGVFVSDDRAQLEALLDEVKVGNKSVLQTMAEWWTKYTSIESILADFDQAAETADPFSAPPPAAAQERSGESEI